jgi:hypothetical protein
MPTEIPISPAAFNGTLGELFDNWAKCVLPSPSIVELFHRRFCDYVTSDNPLFLVRKIADLERGKDVTTDGGLRFRPTDNSPAWWIHYQLFFEEFTEATSFGTFIETVPFHMFHVKTKKPNINKAGWHVGHIFGVGSGDTNYLTWDRSELIWRFARNVHPCSYFYVPLQAWERYGGHPMVIAFFYDKYKTIYKSIWEDYLRLAVGLPHMSAMIGQFKYSY